MTKTKTTKSGFNEWCDKTYSIQKGCKNMCKYCWSERLGNRYGWAPEKWNEPIFNERAFNQSLKKFYKNGVAVFGTHDIYPENVNKCITFISRLLKESENEVLIVTKANYDCITKICNLIRHDMDRVEIRFTITTCSNQLGFIWEPHAPSIEERIYALSYCTKLGFKTSVSIEPFLDKNPLDLILQLLPITTGDIWLGKMNYQSYKYSNKENIQKIVNEIQKNPKLKEKVKLKDSITKMGFRLI